MNYYYDILIVLFCHFEVWYPNRHLTSIIWQRVAISFKNPHSKDNVMGLEQQVGEWQTLIFFVWMTIFPGKPLNGACVAMSFLDSIYRVCKGVTSFFISVQNC